MQIKHRGSRKLLYRSNWVKKNSEGNTHGFARQQFVGSLANDAETISDELALRLSVDELAFVQRAVVVPARAAAEAARKEAERRGRDPMWRLEEALRLVREAAALSAEAHVPNGRVKSVGDALAAVKTLGGVSRQDARREDPLGDALQAVRAAAKAVSAGHYGPAPAEGVRRSKVYEDWIQLTREVEGTAQQGGLLRALQCAGWVKAKSR